VNPVGPQLTLGTDDVHVWWIDLTRINASDATLSTDERARAARFRQARDRRRWIAAHVALRHLLVQYTEISPDALRLETGSQGKPALLNEPSLRFNLTHAGERAALAVAWQREVGIDLEPLAGDLPGGQEMNALLATTCTPAEAAWITSLPPADRHGAFLRIWTLKEAYLKGIGAGLLVEPRMVEVGHHLQTLSNESPHPRPLSQRTGRGELDVERRCQWQPITTSAIPPLLSALGEGGRGVRAYSHWTLCLLNPGPGWVAALAVAGSQPQISEDHWPPKSAVIRTGEIPK
jgi:4'-phosphopantetheinyl transferase